MFRLYIFLGGDWLRAGTFSAGRYFTHGFNWRGDCGASMYGLLRVAAGDGMVARVLSCRLP